MRWKPNVTVAAVIARDDRYLLVEEEGERGLMLNQPAGHLEDGETLLDAVVREALEETACHFTPRALVGIYQWRDTGGAVTYLRLAFCGDAEGPHPARELDRGIVRTLWCTRDQAAASRAQHRSPWVLTCIDDHLSGRRAPLELIHSLMT
ncbi:MAG: NUDIX hydrolase [Burkholderiales bacterium]